MILPVLSSPVFANPYLRPPVLAFAGEVPPCPGPNVILSEPAFSPLPLRALCELCVKNPRPSTPIVPFQPKPPRKVSTIAPLKSLPRVIHCTKTQIPVLCFQRVGHSSAITGEGEGPPYASPPDPTGENPRGCHPDRREGSAFPLPPLFPTPHLLPFFYLHQNQHLQRNTAFPRVSAEFVRSQPP
jgi:hypothetical protein